MNALRWYIIFSSFLLLFLFVLAFRLSDEKKERVLAGVLVIAYIVPVLYLAVYL